MPDEVRRSDRYEITSIFLVSVVTDAYAALAFWAND
jgi:hypothetical protein